MRTLTARQLHWRLVFAVAGNAVLAFLFPGLSRTRGDISTDALMTGVFSVLAALELVPCLTLLRFGPAWQKSAAVLLLCLPLLALWMAGLTAVGLWGQNFSTGVT